jgi:hypothetical protein
MAADAHSRVVCGSGRNGLNSQADRKRKGSPITPHTVRVLAEGSEQVERARHSCAMFKSALVVAASLRESNIRSMCRSRALKGLAKYTPHPSLYLVLLLPTFIAGSGPNARMHTIRLHWGPLRDRAAAEQFHEQVQVSVYTYVYVCACVCCYHDYTPPSCVVYVCRDYHCTAP